MPAPTVKTKILFLNPIIFAARPTHPSKFAFNVSTKSVTIDLSCIVAGSDFCSKNNTSFTICLIIALTFHHNL